MKYSTKKKLVKGLLIAAPIVYFAGGVSILTMGTIYNKNIDESLKRYNYAEYNQEYILDQTEDLYSQYELGVINKEQLSDGLKNIKDYDVYKFVSENGKETEANYTKNFIIGSISTAVASGVGTGALVSSALVINEKAKKQKEKEDAGNLIM